MIDACRKARVKLMIANRQQYEPNNRALVEIVRSQELGALQAITLDCPPLPQRRGGQQLHELR